MPYNDIDIQLRQSIEPWIGDTPASSKLSAILAAEYQVYNDILVTYDNANGGLGDQRERVVAALTNPFSKPSDLQAVVNEIEGKRSAKSIHNQILLTDNLARELFSENIAIACFGSTNGAERNSRRDAFHAFIQPNPAQNTETLLSLLDPLASIDDIKEILQVVYQNHANNVDVTHDNNAAFGVIARSVARYLGLNAADTNQLAGLAATGNLANDTTFSKKLQSLLNPLASFEEIKALLNNGQLNIQGYDDSDDNVCILIAKNVARSLGMTAIQTDALVAKAVAGNADANLAFSRQLQGLLDPTIDPHKVHDVLNGVFNPHGAAAVNHANYAGDAVWAEEDSRHAVARRIAQQFNLSDVQRTQLLTYFNSGANSGACRRRVKKIQALLNPSVHVDTITSTLKDAGLKKADNSDWDELDSKQAIAEQVIAELKRRGMTVSRAQRAEIVHLSALARAGGNNNGWDHLRKCLDPESDAIALAEALPNGVFDAAYRQEIIARNVIDALRSRGVVFTAAQVDDIIAKAQQSPAEADALKDLLNPDAGWLEIHSALDDCNNCDADFKVSVLVANTAYAFGLDRQQSGQLIDACNDQHNNVWLDNIRALVDPRTPVGSITDTMQTAGVTGYTGLVWGPVDSRRLLAKQVARSLGLNPRQQATLEAYAKADGLVAPEPTERAERIRSLLDPALSFDKIHHILKNKIALPAWSEIATRRALCNHVINELRRRGMPITPTQATDIRTHVGNDKQRAANLRRLLDGGLSKAQQNAILPTNASIDNNFHYALTAYNVGHALGLANNRCFDVYANITTANEQQAVAGLLTAPTVAGIEGKFRQAAYDIKKNNNNIWDNAASQDAIAHRVILGLKRRGVALSLNQEADIIQQANTGNNEADALLTLFSNTATVAEIKAIVPGGAHGGFDDAISREILARNVIAEIKARGVNMSQAQQQALIDHAKTADDVAERLRDLLDESKALSQLDAILSAAVTAANPASNVQFDDKFKRDLIVCNVLAKLEQRGLNITGPQKDEFFARTRELAHKNSKTNALRDLLDFNKDFDAIDRALPNSGTVNAAFKQELIAINVIAELRARGMIVSDDQQTAIIAQAKKGNPQANALRSLLDPMSKVAGLITALPNTVNNTHRNVFDNAFRQELIAKNIASVLKERGLTFADNQLTELVNIAKTGNNADGLSTLIDVNSDHNTILRALPHRVNIDRKTRNEIVATNVAHACGLQGDQVQALQLNINDSGHSLGRYHRATRSLIHPETTLADITRVMQASEVRVHGNIGYSGAAWGAVDSRRLVVEVAATQLDFSSAQKSKAINYITGGSDDNENNERAAKVQSLYNPQSSIASIKVVLSDLGFTDARLKASQYFSKNIARHLGMNAAQALALANYISTPPQGEKESAIKALLDPETPLAVITQTLQAANIPTYAAGVGRWKEADTGILVCYNAANLLRRMSGWQRNTLQALVDANPANVSRVQSLYNPETSIADMGQVLIDAQAGAGGQPFGANPLNYAPIFFRNNIVRALGLPASQAEHFQTAMTGGGAVDEDDIRKLIDPKSTEPEIQAVLTKLNTKAHQINADPAEAHRIYQLAQAKNFIATVAPAYSGQHVALQKAVAAQPGVKQQWQGMDPSVLQTQQKILLNTGEGQESQIRAALVTLGFTGSSKIRKLATEMAKENTRLQQINKIHNVALAKVLREFADGTNSALPSISLTEQDVDDINALFAQPLPTLMAFPGNIYSDQNVVDLTAVAALVPGGNGDGAALWAAAGGGAGPNALTRLGLDNATVNTMSTVEVDIVLDQASQGCVAFANARLADIRQATQDGTNPLLAILQKNNALLDSNNAAVQSNITALNDKLNPANSSGQAIIAKHQANKHILLRLNNPDRACLQDAEGKDYKSDALLRFLLTKDFAGTGDLTDDELQALEKQFALASPGKGSSLEAFNKFVSDTHGSGGNGKIADDKLISKREFDALFAEDHKQALLSYTHRSKNAGMSDEARKEVDDYNTAVDAKFEAEYENLKKDFLEHQERSSYVKDHNKKWGGLFTSDTKYQELEGVLKDILGTEKQGDKAWKRIMRITHPGLGQSARKISKKILPALHKAVPLLNEVLADLEMRKKDIDERIAAFPDAEAIKENYPGISNRKQKKLLKMLSRLHQERDGIKEKLDQHRVIYGRLYGTDNKPGLIEHVNQAMGAKCTGTLRGLTVESQIVKASERRRGGGSTKIQSTVLPAGVGAGVIQGAPPKSQHYDGADIEVLSEIPSDSLAVRHTVADPTHVANAKGTATGDRGSYEVDPDGTIIDSSDFDYDYDGTTDAKTQSPASKMANAMAMAIEHLLARVDYPSSDYPIVLGGDVENQAYLYAAFMKLSQVKGFSKLADPDVVQPLTYEPPKVGKLERGDAMGAKTRFGGDYKAGTPGKLYQDSGYNLGPAKEKALSTVVKQKWVSGWDADMSKKEYKALLAKWEKVDEAAAKSAPEVKGQLSSKKW